MARATTDIRSLARRHTSLAINTLAGIARRGKSEPARVSAAVALLERGWGKPQQDVAVDAAVTVTIRRIIDGSSSDAKVIDAQPLGQIGLVPSEGEGE
ncbi:MAG TPA: hypothetical protein VGP82_09160 [Ktedonobacterales bacterium]|nr:hypothetical protein [Ktedonobacterales bacterium]